jgi:predicted DsbA family dithiol-disulfide isomerase
VTVKRGESTALTTQSGRARNQDRFAKYLVSAYFVSIRDIHRHHVTGI